MARINVGTFNLNNLFSRFNFQADLADAKVVETQTTAKFTLEQDAVTVRKYEGRIVNEKPKSERDVIAKRSLEA